MQENGGARLYYHPYATIDGRSVKYGVITSRHLEEDLAEWSTLYTSGRLHKPTLVVHATPALAELQTRNLSYALHASLLLLPECFSASELFETITSLSYSGDPRFAYGMENDSKVRNIVGANPGAFAELYEAAIAECEFVAPSTEGHFQAAGGAGNAALIAEQLPAGLKRRLCSEQEELVPLGDRGDGRRWCCHCT